MVRGLSDIQSLADLKSIAISVNDNSTPNRLEGVANIHFVPELRHKKALAQ